MGVKGVFLQYKLKLIKNLDFGKNQKSVFFGCKGSSVLNIWRERPKLRVKFHS